MKKIERLNLKTNNSHCEFLYWNGRNYVSFSDFYKTALSGYVYTLEERKWRKK